MKYGYVVQKVKTREDIFRENGLDYNEYDWWDDLENIPQEAKNLADSWINDIESLCHALTMAIGFTFQDCHNGNIGWLDNDKMVCIDFGED
jgi:hypothetical protein